MHSEFIFVLSQKKIPYLKEFRKYERKYSKMPVV